MRIALIWPFGYDPKYVIPLSLGYLKSNLDKRHNVKIIDCAIDDIKSSSERFKEMLTDFNPDMVCVSTWSPTYKEAINILKVAKSINPKIITVIGGAHVTSYPDEVIKEKFVDYIFRGESELSFSKFVEELNKENPNFSKVKGLMYKKSEKIIKNQMEREKELDKIKFPDYKAIRLQDYLKIGYKFNTEHNMNAPIWVTRGCPYCCRFCSASILNGNLIRKHSIKYLLSWIKYLIEEEGITHINIIDDNFTFDSYFAKDFCREVIKLNLKGITFGTPNGIRMNNLDEELLALMKKAGWEFLIVAPESGSKKVLKLMKKSLDPDIVPEKVKMIKKAGFKVHGFFIIGYPGETKEDLKQTLYLLRKCDFDFFFLNNFQPLPGTPIFDELVERNELSRDFLPVNYSDGKRDYTPKELEDVNFARLVILEYVRHFMKSPSKLFYAFKIYNPKLLVSKARNNLNKTISSRSGEIC